MPGSTSLLLVLTSIGTRCKKDAFASYSLGYFLLKFAIAAPSLWIVNGKICIQLSLAPLVLLRMKHVIYSSGLR